MKMSNVNVTVNIKLGDALGRAVAARATSGFEAQVRTLTPIRPHEARRAKKCGPGKACGNSCIAKSKACLQGLSPEQKKLAQKAREAMKTGQIGDAVNLPNQSLAQLVIAKSVGFGFNFNDFDSYSYETFELSSGKKIDVATPNSGTTYETPYTGGQPSGMVFLDKTIANYYALQAATLDINQVYSFQSPKKNLKTEEVTELAKEYEEVLATAPNNSVVIMNPKSKSQRDLAERIGLKPAELFYNSDLQSTLDIENRDDRLFFLNNAKKNDTFIGRKENGKIVPITREFSQQVIDIKKNRYEQLNNALNLDFKSEDKISKVVDTLEDSYLGRTPTKIGSLKSYQRKAEDWATQIFGKFDDGANGFSLAQTKAHDVAHPITHELLNSSSKGIHSRLGALKQKDGKDSLIGEEAIVNVVEHLSRGDSIEASILNGLRLSRVLSRAPTETPEARNYVRSREFKNEIAKMAHELYRHDNFSLYMRHVRETNRISGTVTVSGDDFTNSASGG